MVGWLKGIGVLIIILSLTGAVVGIIGAKRIILEGKKEVVDIALSMYLDRYRQHPNDESFWRPAWDARTHLKDELERARKVFAAYVGGILGSALACIAGGSLLIGTGEIIEHLRNMDPKWRSEQRKKREEIEKAERKAAAFKKGKLIVSLWGRAGMEKPVPAFLKDPIEELRDLFTDYGQEFEEAVGMTVDEYKDRVTKR